LAENFSTSRRLSFRVKKTALRSIASSKRERRMNGIADLYAAVKQASVQRIRPKMMTEPNLVWTIADHVPVYAPPPCSWLSEICRP
jgi:hypothetical protein